MAFKYSELAKELRSGIDRGDFPHKLPTEEALAEQYGVSRQTVRRALEQLVERGVIKKRQGSGSRVVEPGRSSGRRVAIVTTFVNEYIFSRVIHDIQEVLSQQGYSTLLFATQNMVTRERAILQGLLKQPLDGIIVEGSKSALPNPNLDLYEKLSLAGIPIVFIHGCYEELKGTVCVSDDNYGGGYLLARHLIAMGHTGIAGVFKSDDIQGLQRYQGFQAALRDAGLPLADGEVMWYTTAMRHYLLDYGHMEQIDHFLSFYLKDCTAVVCYNDEIADSIIRRLLAAGKRVPEDVAVVSFDNSYYCDLCPVSITSLAHEPHRMGSVAAQLLLRRIAGEEVESLTLPWRLRQRQSG